MEAKAQARHRAFRNIAITFAVLTVLLLIVVAYTAYTSAVIKVKLDDVVKDVSFRVALTEERIDHPLEQQAVKATFLESTETASGTFTPEQTGERTGKAGGTVTLHNETDRSQPLVATTRLLTADGVLFRLKQAVRVPAQGTLDAVVEADGTGSETEIGPSKFTIPGLNKTLQESIYATSSAPMVRGATTEKTVSAEDLEKARLSLRNGIIEKARTAAEATTKTTLSDEDLVVTITRETSSAKAGDSASSFTMSLTATVVAVIADTSDVRKQIEQQVQGTQISDDDELTYTLVNYDPIAKTVTMDGKATTERTIDRNSSIFDPVNFIGMTPEQVVSFLENYEGIASVEVTITPYWQKRLPRVPSRVQIAFE